MSGTLDGDLFAIPPSSAQRGGNALARLRGRFQGVVGRTPGSAGRGAVDRLRGQRRIEDRSLRYLHDGVSLARTAGQQVDDLAGELSQLRNVAKRAGAAAARAEKAGGSLSEPARTKLQREYDAIASRLDDVIGSAQFRGHKLLDGSLSGQQALRLTSLDGSDHELDIGDQHDAVRGLSGRDATHATTLAAIDDALGKVGEVRDTVDSFAAGVFAEIRSELRSGARGARIETVADAEKEADQLRTLLLQRAGDGLSAHTPRFDNTLLGLLD